MLERLLETFARLRARCVAAPCRVALIGEDEALTALATDAAALVTPGTRAFAPFRADALTTADAQPAAWLTSAQVNFCALAYRAVHEADAAAPALAVLGRYLQDGFLHRVIREKGGAYGSGAGYDADSQTFRFFSYRDPRLGETFADFERAQAWFAGDRDAQRLEEAILGAVRAFDQPRSPAGEAERAFVSRLCGRDDASRQRFRGGLLGVTQDSLHEACARYLGAGQGVRAALGASDSAAALAAVGLDAARL